MLTQLLSLVSLLWISKVCLDVSKKKIEFLYLNNF